MVPVPTSRATHVTSEAETANYLIKVLTRFGGRKVGFVNFNDPHSSARLPSSPVSNHANTPLTGLPLLPTVNGRPLALVTLFSMGSPQA